MYIFIAANASPPWVFSTLIRRFRLFPLHTIQLSPRLPIPRPGEVLGLVGTNGIGKSTALKVLSGKCKPNLGRFADPPDWQVRIFQEMENAF